MGLNGEEASPAPSVLPEVKTFDYNRLRRATYRLFLSGSNVHELPDKEAVKSNESLLAENLPSLLDPNAQERKVQIRAIMELSKNSKNVGDNFTRFLLRNLREISRLTEDEEIEFLSDAIDLCDQRQNDPNFEQNELKNLKEQAINTIEGNFDQLKSGMLVEDDAFRVLAASRGLLAIYKNGTTDQKREDARKVLIDSISKNGYHPLLLSRAIFSSDINELDVQLLENIFPQFNVDWKDIDFWWRQNRLGYEAGKLAAESIGIMLELEKSSPGSANALYERFGIRNFLRYPKEVLLKQVDEMNDKDRDYGVLIGCQFDHNYSLARPETITGLLRGLQGKQVLRIMEASSTKELVSLINYSRKTYGKISFGILGGHGDEEEIQIGRHNSLEIDDIKRKGAPSITAAFKPDATVILISCSTGKENGIAEKMANLGLNIIAPDSNTSIRKIGVSYDENGMATFDVEYSSANTKFFKGAKKALPLVA